MLHSIVHTHYVYYVGLCHNQTLLTLEVGSNHLTDSSAVYLSDALQINRRLEGLSLWQNNITSEVFIILL